MGRVATEDELADLLGTSPETPDDTSTKLVGRERWNAEACKELTGPARVGLGKYAGASKLNQTRLRAIITNLREFPVVAVMLRNVGISNCALKYWLSKSADGDEGDGFDVLMNPDAPPDDQYTMRFHEAYDEALFIGLGHAEEVLVKRATGYEKVLTHQGRVTYKEDPEKRALGLIGPEAYLLDPKTGLPVPETVWEQDPECLMFMLKTRKPETYGNKQTIDVTHRGGVLVVSAKAQTGADLNVEEDQYKLEAIDVEFEEVVDDDTA